MSARDDAHNWSAMQRRRWAIEMVLTHLNFERASVVVSEATLLERYLLCDAPPQSGDERTLENRQTIVGRGGVLGNEASERKGDDLGTSVRASARDVAPAGIERSGRADRSKALGEKVEDAGFARDIFGNRVEEDGSRKQVGDDSRAVAGGREVVHVTVLIGGVAAPMMAKEGEADNASPSGRA